jgi:hypothetical protein
MGSKLKMWGNHSERNLHLPWVYYNKTKSELNFIIVLRNVFKISRHKSFTISCIKIASQFLPFKNNCVEKSLHSSATPQTRDLSWFFTRFSCQDTSGISNPTRFLTFPLSFSSKERVFNSLEQYLSQKWQWLLWCEVMVICFRETASQNTCMMIKKTPLFEDCYWNVNCLS